MESRTMGSDPLEIFVSYAHEDAALLDELEKQLRILERQGLAELWSDGKIQPGGEWRKEIYAHLRSAHFILLLISADFINSNFCWGIEMEHAIERHEAGTATVIPVILRACDWESAPFGRLNALPRGGKPLTQADDINEAMRGVVQELRQLISESRARQPAGEGPRGGS